MSVMEQVAADHGTAFRMAFPGLLTALVNRKTRSSLLVRDHLGLAHRGGNLKRIDVYVNPSRSSPLVVDGIDLRTSSEMAMHACGILRQEYGVESRFRPVEQPAGYGCSEEVFYGCMDDRFFLSMGEFIQQEAKGAANYFSWAGVVTCPHAHEFGVRSKQSDHLVRQLRSRFMGNARVINIVVHEDCAGHGGTLRLGDVSQQIDYFRARIGEEQDRLQGVRPDVEYRIFFAHVREPAGIERIALWKPAA